MFNFYDEKSCQFECRIKHSILESHCVPWEYPTPLGLEADWNGFPICTSVSGNKGLAKFERAMNSAKSLKDCDCLPNCEEVAFETQVLKLLSGSISKDLKHDFCLDQHPRVRH